MKFAIIGNYGVNDVNELAVANLVHSWNPDFIITTGDNNYPIGASTTIDANIGQYYHSYIGNYIGSYGAGSSINRFFPTAGNRDWAGIEGLQPYLDYFTLPGNERYYDFVSGPIHFFMLDSDNQEPDGTAYNSVQGTWLMNGLATSASQWQVVVFHHSPYDSSVNSSTWYMRWPFAEWGADIVLSAHQHIYERLYVNGLPYVVNGLGGAEIHAFSATPHPNSLVRYNESFGAQLVTVYDCKMVYDFYNIQGVRIDRLEIGGCAEAPTSTATPTATNTPDGSETATPTLTPIAMGPVTLYPLMDTYIRSDIPTSNFGSATAFKVDSSPILRSYLRFDVPSVAGTITSARLRIYSRSSNTTGYRIHTTSGDWDELTLTYNNAPEISDALISSGETISGIWQEIDITSLINGAGEYNFVLTTTNNTSQVLASRESSDDPHLIIQFATGSTSTPLPTHTPMYTFTPLPTFTASPTVTPSETPTDTPTFTPTPEMTATHTPSPEPTATDTPSPTFTASPTLAPSETPTDTPSATLSPMPTATNTLPPTGGATITLNPVADTYVQSNMPTDNFGTITALRHDSSPALHSFIRFEVPALSGYVVSAKLRIYARSNNSTGFMVHLTSSDWDELSLNYNNAPAYGDSISSSGAIAAYTWIEVDVSSVVTGAGQYNFVLTSTSSVSTVYSSREHSNQPELVIIHN